MFQGHWRISKGTSKKVIDGEQEALVTAEGSGHTARSSRTTREPSCSVMWRKSHRPPCSSAAKSFSLELYFSDKRNFLIVFKDKRERQSVVTKLSNKSDSTSSISKSIVGNFVLDQVARAVDRSEQQLEAITRKWQHREISNVSSKIGCRARMTLIAQFAYLQLLNQHANRTPNGETSTIIQTSSAED